MKSKRNNVAVNNSMVGIISQIVKTISTLISRKVFVAYLGIELLGINGVLNNLLNMLQLTELGIGAAIIYALYEPLVKSDKKTIIQLMNIYKKLYRVIGCTIILFGVILSFFIGFFIHSNVYSINYISMAFFVSLAATAATYFLSYKRQLLYADQKQNIYTIVDTIINIICCILQIFVMILFKSFILYLWVQAIQVVLSNVIVLLICNKMYPYLNNKVSGSYEKKKELIHNVKDVFIGQIGGYVYSSTDNLVISKLVNVAAVGYLSNYTYITAVCKSLCSSLTAPLRPIIGNYIREQKNMNAINNIFNVYTFVMYIIASIVVPGVCVLSDSFILLWLGKGFTISEYIVYLLVFDLYVFLVHSPTGEFLTVLGYFRYDKVFSLVGMFLNLFISIIMVFKFGVAGVLIGTAVAQIFYWIARSHCLYKNYFKTGYFKYGCRVMYYIITNIIEIFVLKLIVNHLIKKVTIITFFIEILLVTIISVIYVIILWWNSSEFKDLRRRGNDLIHKR